MNEVADRLYVGDIDDAKRLGTAHEFDAVITLINDDIEASTTSIPLTDGENNQTDFDKAVDAVRSAWTDEQRVFVHCNMGVSRSVTVAATALAAETDITLREALTAVERARPAANPHPDLISHGYTYLGTEPPRPFSDES